MAITFINKITFTPGQLGGTSGSVDMTGGGGADFFVASIGGGANETMSDSVNGSTWTHLARSAGGNPGAQIAYKWNASNGAAMTFAVANGGGGYPPTIVYGFKGVQTSSDPIDVERHSDTTGTGTTFQYGGSLTPSAAGHLFIAMVGDYLNTEVLTINSGFSTPDTLIFTSSINYQGSASYKISSGTGAEQPTWTDTTATFQGGCACIACFKAAAGGGGGGGGKPFSYYQRMQLANFRREQQARERLIDRAYRETILRRAA